MGASLKSASLLSDVMPNGGAWTIFVLLLLPLFSPTATATSVKGLIRTADRVDFPSTSESRATALAFYLNSTRGVSGFAFTAKDATIVVHEERVLSSREIPVPLEFRSSYRNSTWHEPDLRVEMTANKEQ